MSTAVRIPVTEPSQTGEARRAAVKMAARLGFNETEAGNIAILVTETATNLLKHGSGGEILLNVSNDGPGLEIIGLDKGRGMESVAACLRDGYSTAGSNGSGLGAMARLSTALDIYSALDKGTVIVSRTASSGAARQRDPIEVAGFCVPIAGEQICGDAWASRHTPDESLIFMVDGLGHGVLAGDAASEAVAAFLECVSTSPIDILNEAHRRLRSTRGAAAAVASIHRESGAVNFAGIGNIAGVLVDGGVNRHLVSMNGTLGHNVRQFRAFSYPWSSSSLLILHSDGLGTRWDLSSYSGLAQRSPTLIAAVLYRDMQRERDDSSIAVAREKGAE